MLRAAAVAFAAAFVVAVPGGWAKDPVVEAAEAAAAAIRAQTGAAAGQAVAPKPAVPAQARPADAPSNGPRRRDGYWEMRSLREDGSLRTTQFLCVGNGSENDFSIWDQITIMGGCSRKELNRTGAGWAFDARCELFGNAMESKGTMSGDFRDRFRVDLTVVEDGRRQVGSIRGEHKGACPAKYKPGDLVSDRGSVLMNVLD